MHNPDCTQLFESQWLLFYFPCRLQEDTQKDGNELTAGCNHRSPVRWQVTSLATRFALNISAESVTPPRTLSGLREMGGRSTEGFLYINYFSSLSMFHLRSCGYGLQ